MKKHYKSKRALILKIFMKEINRWNLLPTSFKKIDPRFRDALLGRSSKTEVIEKIVEKLEEILKITKPKPTKINLRKKTIKELYEQGLLPKNYANLAAKLSGNSKSNIYWLVKKKLRDAKHNKPSQKAIEAIYSIAEMNKEIELEKRLRNIIEKKTLIEIPNKKNIPKEYKTFLRGKQNKGIYKCIKCKSKQNHRHNKYWVVEDIIGFAESKNGVMVVWKCKNCSQIQFYHLRENEETPLELDIVEKYDQFVKKGKYRFW